MAKFLIEGGMTLNGSIEVEANKNVIRSYIDNCVNKHDVDKLGDYMIEDERKYREIGSQAEPAPKKRRASGRKKAFEEA